MTPLNTGDDVVVDFDGNECRGEVVRAEPSGYVLTRILVDPDADYGSISARLAPISYAMVRRDEIRPVT
jgi:hypothetical protein